MSDLIVSLLPLMIAAAQTPAWIIIILLLLRRANGLMTAAAFAGGMTAVRATQGAAFGLAFTSAMASGNPGQPRTASAVAQILIGVVLLAVAARQFQARDDGRPPAWLTKLDGVTPPAAFGFGALIVLVSLKQWAFTLGALDAIRGAEVTVAGAVIAYALFVLVAESLIVLPLVAHTVARQRSAAVLDRAGVWLERNHRPVVIVVSVIFGTYFLWKGLSAFLG